MVKFETLLYKASQIRMFVGRNWGCSTLGCFLSGHPRKLTCPLKINGWKMYFLLRQSLLRENVSFQGCICLEMSLAPWRHWRSLSQMPVWHRPADMYLQVWGGYPGPGKMKSVKVRIWKWFPEKIEGHVTCTQQLIYFGSPVWFLWSFILKHLPYSCLSWSCPSYRRHLNTSGL